MPSDARCPVWQYLVAGRVGQMWCPSCGDEFRDGFTRCSDCDVALVAHRPTPTPEPDTPQAPARSADHELLEVDLSDWSEDLRAGLDLRLRSAQIPASWEPNGVLVVGQAWREDLDVMLDVVDDEDSEHQGRDGSHLGDGARTRVPDLASPGRRFLGAVIDWMLLGTVAAGTVLVIDGSIRNRDVAALIIGAVYTVVLVAVWGRTVGKAAVGTWVEPIDGSAPPGWGAATIRWAVPALAVLAFPFGAVGFVVGEVWLVAVYAPILGPRRQGLHDRAARTVVLAMVPSHRDDI